MANPEARPPMTAPKKHLLVVAMDNRVEALRVAVGLTMSDAEIDVAVWGAVPADDPAALPQLEALEFGEVPLAALPADDVASWDALARRIVAADAVYCI